MRRRMGRLTGYSKLLVEMDLEVSVRTLKMLVGGSCRTLVGFRRLRKLDLRIRAWDKQREIRWLT